MSLQEQIHGVFPFLSGRLCNGLANYLTHQAQLGQFVDEDVALALKSATDQDLLAQRSFGKTMLEEFRRSCPVPQVKEDRDALVNQAANQIGQALRSISAADLFLLNNRLVRDDLGVRIESL